MSLLLDRNYPPMCDKGDKHGIVSILVDFNHPRGITPMPSVSKHKQ